MHIGVCMCLCVEVLAHGHICVVTGERVVRYMHMSVSVYMCVCVSKSMAELHSHGHMCLRACLHRWLHMGVRWPGPGGMIAGMRSLLCLPTWGGKQGLLMDSLGMAWGWAAWGSRHTDCRDSRLWACPRPLRSTGGTG